MAMKSRVSKRCNHAIARSCKIFENLQKVSANESNSFHVLSQFDDVLLISHGFMSFLMHVSAHNFQSENVECVKEFAF